MHLTFPEDQVTEPVIWAIGHEFQVITNVRRANISDGAGWMALDLEGCLLYTSDAADDLLCVDLGGRRIFKKKKQK